MRHLLLLALTVMTTTLGAISVPSQRDQLIQRYLKVRPEYAFAVKSANQPAFVASVAGLISVGQAIVLANNNAMSAIAAMPLPRDVKSRQAIDAWAKRNQASMASLTESNVTLAGFAPPSEITPATIQAVEADMNQLTKAIETHHSICQGIH